MKKRMLAWIMTGMLALGLLSGCFGGGGQQPPAPTVSEEVTQPPEVSPSAEVEPTAEPEKPVINVAMRHGPAGMGAAKLMAEDEAGETVNEYNFTVYADDDEVVNALVNGEVDIAAIATNVASDLYHKTNGGVKLIAINTYGVLKVLQGGEGNDIKGISQLAGKSIYAVGEGTDSEYVLSYLLTQSGIDPAEDVDIQWMSAQEVGQGILSGAVEFAVLPVSDAAVVCMQSEGKVRQVLDLTEQWDRVAEDSKLVMGCLVARSDFAEASPELIRSFLEEYEASVVYMSDPESLLASDETNPAQLLEKYGILPEAAAAMETLPQTNLTFLSGVRDLRDTIQGYYEVLFAASPDSIGGGIPDDAFYFE